VSNHCVNVSVVTVVENRLNVSMDEVLVVIDPRENACETPFWMGNVVGLLITIEMIQKTHLYQRN